MQRLAIVWGMTMTLAFACGGPTPEVCSGGEDEDADGLIDCGDDDCWVAGGACREVCTTIFDEDGDGMDGCEDPDCWIAGGVCAEACDAAGDEDGDGLSDCDDDDCWVADGPCDERCDGAGHDEDGDGDADCADRSCWLPASGCPEVCAQLGDEDGDGALDCDDDDCAGDLACIPGFAGDVQPVFLTHCLGDNGACHSNDMALGGLSFERYDDVLLPSIYCGAKSTKGACSLFRILEPTMPQDCLGCVPAADIALIAAWVEGGMPP